MFIGFSYLLIGKRDEQIARACFFIGFSSEEVYFFYFLIGGRHFPVALAYFFLTEKIQKSYTWLSSKKSHQGDPPCRRRNTARRSDRRPVERGNPAPAECKRNPVLA